GEELLDGPDGTHQGGRPVDPADLPAGHRERLTCRRDRQRAVGEAGQRGHRDVLDLVVGHVLVDLVGDDHRVELRGQLPDGGELLAGEDGAGRVVRGVDQYEAGAGREGGAQLV